MVSSLWSIIGLTAAISVVFVFPPSESYSNLVILLSLYEIKLSFLPCARLWMTLPKQLRLKLIVFSSSKCYWSMLSSFEIFSEPAKSQRLSLPRMSMPFLFGRLDSTNSWNMVWDLDEWMLDFV